MICKTSAIRAVNSSGSEPEKKAYTTPNIAVVIPTDNTAINKFVLYLNWVSMFSLFVKRFVSLENINYISQLMKNPNL